MAVEGLEIVIGANVSEAFKELHGLEKVIKKLGDSSKVSLKVMQTALSSLEKQIKVTTNPKDFERLSASAAKLRASIAGIRGSGTQAGSGLDKLKNASNQSTQALINLGRVAQDAPFGILGIANNLNPLLESFQRASVAAKETGTSLTKNLLGALTGPAGIGLALSAVSALLIVFGDKLFGAGKSLSAAEIEASKFAASLSDIKVGIDDFFASLDFDNNLQKLKNKLKFGDKAEIFNIGVDKKTADQTVQQTNEQISKATLRIGELISNSAFLLSKDGKKLANAFLSSLQTGTVVPQELIDKLSNSDKKVFDILNENATRIAALSDYNTKARRKSAEADVQIEIQKADDIKKLLDKQKDDHEKFVTDTIAKARQFTKEFGDAIVVPDLEDSFFKTKQDIFEASKKLLDDVSKGEIKLKLPVSIDFTPLPESFDLSEDVIKSFFEDVKQEKGIPLDLTIDPSLSKESIKNIEDIQKQFLAFGDKGLSAYLKLGTGAKGYTEELIKLNTEQNIQLGFANAIGDSFQGVFDTMREGGNVLDGFFKDLGRSLENLIAKLAATAAAAGVLTLITGGGNLALGKGFGAIFGKLLGFAEGGVVTSPTLAMIGEGAGTRNSNPEIVAPLNKLKDLIGNSGSELPTEIRLVANGDQLQGTLNTYNRRFGRGF